MPTLDWFDDESTLHELLFTELYEHEQPLLVCVHLLDLGCSLMRLFNDNPRTLLTVRDIAFRLKQPQARVESSLRELVELELVCQTDLAGIIFYSIGSDPGKRRLVQDLCAWQDRWHTRLTRIKQLVDGRG